MLREMSRWLGEAGRGPQGLMGALETKVCVYDLHDSGLVTWEVSACLRQRGKKRCWKYTQGNARIQGRGSV